MDEVGLIHQHDDGARPMRHDDDERIDGLRLRQYSCDCGYSVAVLARDGQEEPGRSWPFRFRAPLVS